MKATCILLCIVFCFCLHSSAALIKVGDVLDIQVQSHAEFSGKYTVHQNGTIEYPLLADEVVASISTSELMNELTYRLARHIENPLVLISIVAKPDITVTVLGNVVNPGPVETYLGATLQEAIKRAGGLTENANLDSIKIIHKGGRDQSAEYFNLQQFMKTGSIDAMPFLQADDIIVVLEQNRARKVKVIGAVAKPGFFDLEEKVTVFELIYLAGGPAEKADLSRVRRFFTVDNRTREEIINIQSYIDKGEMDRIPFVDEGDVIIVYSRWFDWKMIMNILSNVLLFIVTIQSLRGAVSK